MTACIQMISSYMNLVYYVTCFDNQNITHKIFGIFLGLFCVIALYFGYNDIKEVTVKDIISFTYRWLFIILMALYQL